MRIAHIIDWETGQAWFAIVVGDRILHRFGNLLAARSKYRELMTGTSNIRDSQGRAS